MKLDQFVEILDVRGKAALFYLSVILLEKGSTKHIWK